MTYISTQTLFMCLDDSEKSNNTPIFPDYPSSGTVPYLPTSSTD